MSVKFELNEFEKETIEEERRKGKGGRGGQTKEKLKAKKERGKRQWLKRQAKER